MADTSARVDKAVAGSAITGTSDMPDIGANHFTWEGHCWEAVADPKLLVATMDPAASATAKEALTARLVQSMSVQTKQLVVTEEAILNHATLLGSTVVEQINVQDKLVGKDGVFTGTVDFANVNVTGELLAAHVSGEHIYGTVLEGGEIITTDAGGGQVSLSDTGFVDPGDQVAYPGIKITPADPSKYVTPPGIGPNPNGMILTGGRTTNGGRGFSIYTPTAMAHSYQLGSARSDVHVQNRLAYVESDDGAGNQGQVRATPSYARVRSDQADGAYGTVEAGGSYAVAATRDPSGNYMSQIRSNGREAYLWSTGSDGLGRVLSVDSNGVWAKAERTDGSGYWDHILLVPEVRQFQYSSLWNADQSPAHIMVQHLPGGKLCQAQIRIQNLSGSKLSLPYDDWVLLNYNPIPADLRGGFTDYIETTLPQLNARGRVEMNYSTGRIRIKSLEKDKDGNPVTIDWHNNNSIWFPMRWFSPN